MAKEIRFAQLVKLSGQPESITLWTEPEKNADFMKAVRQNRVLTVIQRPAAHAKDFGTIGFLKEHNALYLIFPKPLPKEPDAHIVGIKYDTLQTESAPKAVKKAEPSQKPGEPAVRRERQDHSSRNGHESAVVASPPQAKTFRVTIHRTASLETELTVEAENFHQAEQTALATIRKEAFHPEEIQDEVKSISAVGTTGR